MRYSNREERANTISHAIGILFGVLVCIVLINKAYPFENAWSTVSYIIYGVFMTFSYITSTLYHNNSIEDSKVKLRKFDHAAIYAHIAGTYTPFTLIVLREQSFWGWTLFAVIWTAALVGIVFSFLKLKNASKIETACYVAMGWVVVFAFKPLYDVLSANNSNIVLWWLIAGGLFYTIGAIIYSFKKIEYMHAIWHLFVLGGSICHAIAIWLI